MRLEGVRAITISVQYNDLLAITLPRTKQVFDEVCVVTSSADKETQQVAADNGAQCLVTDAFYDRGAVFNKFAALEQGLDFMGRSGWIAILDADIVLPERDHITNLVKGKLYTPHRRMLTQIPRAIPEERIWRQLKRPRMNEEFAGYCQIFHADDPVLGHAPWHETNWTWAGGADSMFHLKWHERNKIRPPWEVLHLGEAFTNWAGRVTPFADGSVPENAEERRGVLRNLLNQRKYHRGVDRYEAEKLK